MAPIALDDKLAPLAQPTKSVATVEQKELTPLEALAHQANSKPLPKIPTFSTFEEKRQWQLEHMAGAFRVWAREGYAEGISGYDASLAL